MTIPQVHQADQRIVEWLQREARHAERVVEFGCGVCTYLPHIPAKRIRTGVDIHRPFLDQCKDDSLDLVQGSMLQWERLELGRFDTAVFIDSLEHVTWPQAKRMVLSLQGRQHVKRILIFAPMGHHPQVDHKCSLYPTDFHKLGFTTEADEDFHHTRMKSRGAFFAVWQGNTQDAQI